MNGSTRFAALVATAAAIPVVLVVAFLVAGDPGRSATTSPSATPGPLLTTVPGPAPDVQAACDPVMATMPVTLDSGDGTTVQPRVAQPGGPSFLAWGNPLITPRCGVARPAWLRDDLAYGTVTQLGAPSGFGASWVRQGTGARETWTVIDRRVYFQAEIPHGDVAFLVQISEVIGRALLQVCTQPEPGDPPDAVYCGSRP